jgi:hypothetical protein
MDGNVELHARQSRIRFDSRTPTDWGQLRTRIETDFFSGGNVFRLRHAFGQLGPLLVGQTWSILGDEDTYANTVDFSGPVGVASARKAQIRYTQGLGDGLTAQVAIEDPGESVLLSSPMADMTDVMTGVGVDEDGEEVNPEHTHDASIPGGSTKTMTSLDRLPNLLAALRYRADWGAVNVSGLLREVNVDNGEDLQESILTHGLHLGATVNVLDSTALRATFNIGNGLSGYVLGTGAVATLSDGELEGQDAYGGFVGIDHGWTDSLSSGLYYGWIEHRTNTDKVDIGVAASENNALRSLHANIWWSPVPRVNIGMEFVQGWRDANDQVGDGKNSGSASRIHLGFQYIF